MRKSAAVKVHSNVSLHVASVAVIKALPYEEGSRVSHVGWPDEFITSVKKVDGGWHVGGIAIASIVDRDGTKRFEFPYTSRFDRHGVLDVDAIRAEVTSAVKSRTSEVKATDLA